MSLAKCFIFIVLLPGSISEICSERNSLFDRGLEKLLKSYRFSAISLPNFSYNEDNLLRLKVDFSGGKLHGFHNIRRHGQSVLSASDSRIWLTFHIEGGPFEAHYNASLKTALERTTSDVNISVPLIQLSFTAQEAWPIELQSQLYDVRMARIGIVFEDTGDDHVSSGFYNTVLDELRPFIQVKIGQMLVEEFQTLAAVTLAEIKAYSRTSLSHTAREGGSAAAGDRRKATGSARTDKAPPSGSQSSGSGGDGAYGNDGAIQMLSRSGLLPARAGLPRQRDIFEGCLKKLIQSAGFDPAPLPRDLEVFSLPTGRVTAVEGNITGLSNIRRKGENLAALASCGMLALLSLAVKNLTITATASGSGSLWGFDINAPEVEVLLGIRENNAGLQIVASELKFAAPVTVTAKMPSATGTAANPFGGLPQITLGTKELKQLEDLFRKYVQRIVYALQESISDAPLQPTA